MSKITERADITAKVETLIAGSCKRETSEELGMSRPTLDNKLKTHKWKKLEITQIEKLHEQRAKGQ